MHEAEDVLAQTPPKQAPLLGCSKEGHAPCDPNFLASMDGATDQHPSQNRLPAKRPGEDSLGSCKPRQTAAGALLCSPAARAGTAWPRVREVLLFNVSVKTWLSVTLFSKLFLYLYFIFFFKYFSYTLKKIFYFQSEGTRFVT